MQACDFTRPAESYKQCHNQPKKVFILQRETCDVSISLHTHPLAHGISSELPVLNVLYEWNHPVQAVSGCFFLDNSLFTIVSCFFSLWILGLFPLLTIVNNAHLVFLWWGRLFLKKFLVCIIKNWSSKSVFNFSMKNQTTFQSD